MTIRSFFTRVHVFRVTTASWVCLLTSLGKRNFRKFLATLYKRLRSWTSKAALFKMRRFWVGGCHSPKLAIATSGSEEGVASNHDPYSDRSVNLAFPVRALLLRCRGRSIGVGINRLQTELFRNGFCFRFHGLQSSQVIDQIPRFVGLDVVHE